MKIADCGLWIADCGLRIEDGRLRVEDCLSSGLTVIS
jgi:hypothetical protein